MKVEKADLSCKDPGIDSLRHNHHGHLGRVSFTKESETLGQLLHLVTSHSSKLAIPNAVAVNNNAIRQCLVHLERRKILFTTKSSDCFELIACAIDHSRFNPVAGRSCAPPLLPRWR